jgi:hypothetical protein
MKHHLLVLAAISTTIFTVGCNQQTPPPPAPPTPAPVTNAAAALPPGHPPLDAAPGKLPSGHPPLDMSSQTLPSETLSQATNPQWTLPADWKPGRPSSVRRGSFVVNPAEGQSAEIAVTVFPGDVGGPLANVNRWRSQIDLPPVTTEEAAKMTTTVDANGIPVAVVDFSNPTPPEGKKYGQRMIVATIPKDGNSWFVKMTGDEPAVAAQKEAFLKFVASIKF